METKYSFKKGLVKAIVTALTVGISIVAFAGFSDLTIWGLLETYLKPLVGGMTVGALLKLALNWVKVKYLV